MIVISKSTPVYRNKLNPPITDLKALGGGELIEVLAIYRMQVAAFENRVSQLVVWLLLCSAIISMVATGYSGGLNRHRGILANVLLAIPICGTIFVILSLDRPGRGFIQVSQSPLIHLTQTIDKDISIK